MGILDQLLFLISVLGTFNGLLLAGYLFFSPSVAHQYKFLAALILVISIRVSKSIWFYFDPQLGQQLLQLGVSACFLIGPLLYFYIAAFTGQLTSLRFKWTWHLGLLIGLIVGLGGLFPYQSHTQLWGGFYQLINYSWAIYIALTGVLLFPKAFDWVGNNTQLSQDELLAFTVYVSTAIIWLAYFTASYTSYIVGALSLSMTLYVSILLWRNEKNHTHIKNQYDVDKR